MSTSNNPKTMNPSDQTPAAHLRGSNVRVGRTASKLPRQSNKSASRPSKGPGSGPRGGAGRIR